MRHTLKLISCLSLSLSVSAFAESFSLSSNDIKEGELMAKAQEYNGFGCSGGDLSPHLKWLKAPDGTKSFAITVHDRDAPTGSGWWHWQVINIPKHVLELATGAGNSLNNKMPFGSLQIANDYGATSFDGACPPQGHGVHHYRFTVHALSLETLNLPEGASGALAGYMINAHTIASASIEALYERD